ncbi:Carboxypeptidase regulatory-like domain-containing protein [Arenibacter palladensis]|uniref:Carboxypeptidase regulatory-like domain-containing protein n=1 Tax=Arenibacter palladensis TaxID=237373 RepID=A0A1M4Z2I1_9FLAO|nr:DUF4382 domain-containing protein [Arenibacter palladensis]SHF12269.1 Carboxypeptidase regulatory-like domain-containing protein [Arenibacter palladensis]
MKIKLFTIALFVVTVLVSCTDNNDKNSDYGRLSVNLTDAPFPHDLVAEANVIIFKIDARYKGDMDINSEVEDNSDSSMTTEEKSSFVVLMEDEMEVNLLELTNGVTKNLVDLDVPVGIYDLVRVYVKGVNVVLTDGSTFDLKVPSGEQTGIKIFIKPGLVVEGGLSADLLLDFDVSKSFVAKGGGSKFENITGFNFKPVIKACNMSTAGTLSGKVTTLQEEIAVGLEGAQVAVFAADTLNTTTFTDADGKYMVMGLMAGSYDVEVELSTYQEESVTDIEIVAGNTTSQDFILVAGE